MLLCSILDVSIIVYGYNDNHNENSYNRINDNIDSNNTTNNKVNNRNNSFTVKCVYHSTLCLHYSPRSNNIKMKNGKICES